MTDQNALPPATPSAPPTSPPTGGPFSSGRSISFGPFFMAALVGIAIVTAVYPMIRHEVEPPPVVGVVQPYKLTNQDGQPFDTKSLADGNKVAVVNFVFTSCPSYCPELTRSMKRLQDRLKLSHIEGVQLISISVDPETDTPEKLKAYATKFGADLSNWVFLTGSPKEIRDVVVEGFKTHLGDRQPAGDDLFDIAHSVKFILVDGTGGIRGYFDSDEVGIDEVFHRAQHVLKDQAARAKFRSQGIPGVTK
jgi:protein SCO1